jgi:hypothetical protein
MLSYEYEPLQHNDSIRILVLHPSPEESDPITCTIQHVRLSDAQLRYEALSYTWGDPTQQYEIHFPESQSTLTVGKTCRDALQLLRLGDRDRLLWIDAICINQQNLVERAQQVRIMDGVFNHAESVVVFLGQQVPESLALFEKLTEIDELELAFNEVGKVYGSGCHTANDVITRELEILFERPWFKRVWVLQEVCGNPAVWIMCGSVTVTFTALSSLYYNYPTTVVCWKIWPIALDWIQKPPEVYSSPQLNLWNRLYHSRDCVATDPRDKIFALKSLVGPGQEQMDYLIDYTQGLDVCLIEVARFLLPVLGLRILTAVRHPHSMEIPSWTPDWSQNFPLTYERFVPDVDGKLPGRPTPCFESRKEPKYTICSSGTNQVNKDCLELVVTGVQYARIIERSQVFQFDSLEDAERQMTGLYISLGKLFGAESIISDTTARNQLGQPILTGKHIQRL